MEIPFHLPDSIEGYLSPLHKERPPQSYAIYVNKFYWGAFHLTAEGWQSDGRLIDRYKELHGDPSDYFLTLINQAQSISG